jgi:hypothetical protein
MKLKLVLSLLILFTSLAGFAQIKIGDNPQNINAGSLLELESTNRAFVITRVTTVQMNAITPIEGAMVYNTDIQCLHYYDGADWLNLCEALGLTITNNPVVHADTTIAITRTDNNINIEVDSITGLQIVDRSIRREDLANSSVGGAIVQDRSIPITKLVAGGTPGQIIEINTAGTDAVWVDPPPKAVALGKVNGNTELNVQGASIGGSNGVYTVNLLTPRANDNYIIQLTVAGSYKIFVINQLATSFTIRIEDTIGDPIGNAEWYFTVFDF